MPFFKHIEWNKIDSVRMNSIQNVRTQAYKRFISNLVRLQNSHLSRKSMLYDYDHIQM